MILCRYRLLHKLVLLPHLTKGLDDKTSPRLLAPAHLAIAGSETFSVAVDLDSVRDAVALCVADIAATAGAVAGEVAFLATVIAVEAILIVCLLSGTLMLVVGVRFQTTRLLIFRCNAMGRVR
jgi:hypothetical protein